MEYSDYDLIRGIKSGDGDALELLVRRWYPRIFGYVQKTLGNEQDAYDITQEIFLSVVQNIKGEAFGQRKLGIMFLPVIVKRG